MCKCHSNSTKALHVMKIPTSDKWLLPPITPWLKMPGQYRAFRQQSTTVSFSDPTTSQDVHKEPCPKCRYIFLQGRVIKVGIQNLVMVKLTQIKSTEENADLTDGPSSINGLISRCPRDA